MRIGKYDQCLPSELFSPIIISYRKNALGLVNIVNRSYSENIRSEKNSEDTDNVLNSFSHLIFLS